MNDQQLENKVRKDADKVKKDLNTLVGDSAVRLSRFEDNVSQATGKAKEEITKWMEDSVSQFNEEFEKITGNAKESMAAAAVTVKQDVRRGLNQYNDKAQEVANKIPGGFSENAARYPWVAISIGVALGFFLGVLLKPSRHTNG